MEGSVKNSAKRRMENLKSQTKHAVVELGLTVHIEKAEQMSKNAVFCQGTIRRLHVV